MSSLLEVALCEWDSPDRGPRLLGTSMDPELVRVVTDHLAARRRRELATLTPPVRPVPDPEDGPDAG